MNTKNNKKINSLYIHIPFCSSICPYCDFVKVLDIKKFKPLYIEQLIKDINLLVQKRYFFNTIYIGGGTPSVLELDQLEALFKSLEPLINDLIEFTIEANPESLTEDKLALFKRYGVNRISIGIQSFKKSILKRINRDYDVDIDKLIASTKKYIQNINVDFIYGLPGQTIEDVKEDLGRFIKLDINHISTYSLILEKGTQFYTDGVEEIDDNDSRILYDLILKTLRQNGFERYEVSNFAKPGFESKHNLTYWHDEEYVGVGIGASGFENNIRYKNSSSLTSYLKGERNREEEVVNLNDDIEYYLICNLRLRSGFKVADFDNRFNTNLLKNKENEIDELIKNGLVQVDNGRFMCTDEGIIMLDIVLLKLI